MEDDMKRKTVIAIIVLAISVAGFYGAGKLQKNETDKQIAKSEVKIEAKVEATKDKEVGQESSNEETNLKEQEKNNKNEPVSTVPQQVKEEAKPVPESNVNKQTSNAVQSGTVKQEKEAQPAEVSNFVITDSISGKVILSKRISFNGETAAQATTAALDDSQISYKTVVFGSSIYFSSISGIRERSAGASSGWCYFINGKKMTVGAGDYKLNQNDKLEWKFLKDGLSD
jgi:hypothetical protein